MRGEDREYRSRRGKERRGMRGEDRKEQGTSELVCC